MIKFLKLTQQNYVLPPTPYYRHNMEPKLAEAPLKTFLILLHV